LSGSDPLSLAFRIARLLEELDIPYAVAGAVASTIHGEPRATEDLGLIAAVEPRLVDALISKLGSDYYVPTGHLRHAVTHGGSFNVIHLASVRKIDIFVAAADPFTRQELERRALLTIPEHEGRRLWIASPEDVLLHKLRWYADGGSVSDRQWRDVLGIVKVQGRRLDRAYLARWADILGVSPLLQRVWRETGVEHD
jgi:hypothetical protein